VSKRWCDPEAVYRRSFLHMVGAKSDRTPQLGDIQCVPVGPELDVVNMIAQRGYGTPEHPRVIDYPAVRTCLAAVVEHIAGKPASMHMPRIGCHLAGGKWEEIEPIIQDTLVRAGIEVTVYDLPVDKWTGFQALKGANPLGTL
jgi:hypothetical protein